MMRKVQRITAVLLAAMMVFALASCGGSKREEAASASPSPSGTASDVSATPLAGQQETVDNLTYASIAGHMAYAMCDGENGELWVATIPNRQLLDNGEEDICRMLIRYGADGKVLEKYQMDQFVFYDAAGKEMNSVPRGFGPEYLVRKGDVFYGSRGGPLSLYEIDPAAGSVRILPLDYHGSWLFEMIAYGDDLALLSMPGNPSAILFNYSNNPLLYSGISPYELVVYSIEDRATNVMELPDPPQMITQADNGRVTVLSADDEHYLLDLDPGSATFGDKTYIGSVGMPTAIARASNPDAFLWYIVHAENKVINARFADDPNTIYTLMNDIGFRGNIRLMHSDGFLYTISQSFKSYTSENGRLEQEGSSTIYRRVFEKPEKAPLQIDTTFTQIWQPVQPDLWTRWIKDYQKLSGDAISVLSRFVSKEQMIAAALSGASDVDAFIMSYEEACSLGLPGNGAHVPLSGDNVTQFYDGTFDWIEELFALPGSPGSYWAIPVYLDSFKLYYNPEKLAERGLTESVFDTYDSFLPAALEMAADGVIGLGESHHMQQNQLRQLFNPAMRTVALDSVLLAVALNRITEIGAFMTNDAYDLYNSYMKYRDATVRLDIDAEALWEATRVGDDLSNFAVASFPKLDDSIESANVMQMSILFINPHSARKAELLQLAECIAETHLTPKLASAMYPWTPIMLEDKTVYSEVYDINSNLFNSLHDYNANGCVSWIPEDVNIYVESFLAGEANLEDTVFAIERYLDMMEREQR